MVPSLYCPCPLNPIFLPFDNLVWNGNKKNIKIHLTPLPFDNLVWNGNKKNIKIHLTPLPFDNLVWNGNKKNIKIHLTPLHSLSRYLNWWTHHH
jgi:hypothetical protein